MKGAFGLLMGLAMFPLGCTQPAASVASVQDATEVAITALPATPETASRSVGDHF